MIAAVCSASGPPPPRCPPLCWRLISGPFSAARRNQTDQAHPPRNTWKKSLPKESGPKTVPCASLCTNSPMIPRRIMTKNVTPLLGGRAGSRRSSLLVA